MSRPEATGGLVADDLDELGEVRAFEAYLVRTLVHAGDVQQLVHEGGHLA